jgi:hypothetical protein
MTTVEWLVEKIKPLYIGNFEITFSKEIEQAKEMFEKQIIGAYNDGCIDTLKNEMKIGKQYYNEVFKK